MIDLIWKNRVMDYVINIITYEQFIITKSHTSAILNVCQAQEDKKKMSDTVMI